MRSDRRSSGLNTPSFRDPAGTVFRMDGRILRVVRPMAEAALREFLSSRTCSTLLDSRRLTRMRDLSRDEAQLLALPPGAAEHWVLEHEAVAFPSYPSEWPPEMLHAAAVLHLDIAETALKEGFGLKDASPFNCMFNAAQPIFLDWLSFERRDPRDPTWLAYAQFVRTFVLPLLLHAASGVPPAQWFINSREGIEVRETYRMLPALQRLKPVAFKHATLPAWLEGKAERQSETLYRPQRSSSEERAKFVLGAAFRGLRRALRAVEPAQRDSRWSDYETSCVSYEPAQSEAKETLVRQTLTAIPPGDVLDIGCNTGNYSAIAAAAGHSVVAIDSDAAAVGRLWKRASRENLNILPLAVSLSNPTPATGWRNGETLSFLSRAEQRFDCVLFLGVMHHLLVTDRIPLDEIVDMLATLTRSHAIVEFVAPADPMFVKVARGRDRLHQGLSLAGFEDAARTHFEIVSIARIPGMERWLAHLKKR